MPVNIHFAGNREFLLISDSFILQAKIILQLSSKLNANTQNGKLNTEDSQKTTRMACE